MDKATCVCGLVARGSAKDAIANFGWVPHKSGLMCPACWGLDAGKLRTKYAVVQGVVLQLGQRWRSLMWRSLGIDSAAEFSGAVEAITITCDGGTVTLTGGCVLPIADLTHPELWRFVCGPIGYPDDAQPASRRAALPWLHIERATAEELSAFVLELGTPESVIESTWRAVAACLIESIVAEQPTPHEAKARMRFAHEALACYERERQKAIRSGRRP